MSTSQLEAAWGGGHALTILWQQIVPLCLQTLLNDTHQIGWIENRMYAMLCGYTPCTCEDPALHHYTGEI